MLDICIMMDLPCMLCWLAFVCSWHYCRNSTCATVRLRLQYVTHVVLVKFVHCHSPITVIHRANVEQESGHLCVSSCWASLYADPQRRVNNLFVRILAQPALCDIKT